MNEENFSKLSSYKEEKVKSYTMSYNRDVVKFAQQHSTNLAASRFGVDRKRIREWIRSIDEIAARAPTKKKIGGGGWKPVIIEIEEKLLKWIPEHRLCMLYISHKMIHAKAKASRNHGTIVIMG